MSDWLQYGALGVLTLTIGAVGIFLQRVIAPLASGLLKILPAIYPMAAELRNHVIEIRCSLATLVERADTSKTAHERHDEILTSISEEVRDLHHDKFGTNGGVKAARR